MTLKKSTKGAFAGATAAILLLGGAGTLANWNAEGTVGGGDLTSGELKLTDQDCDPEVGTTASVWMLDGIAPADPTVFDASADTLVPGDTLTKVCTFTIAASGTHLTADLDTEDAELTNGATPNALTTTMTVAADYTVDDVDDVDEISSADNGKVLQATVTVTFPDGLAGDNSTQDLSSTLSDYVVTATQSHS